MSVSLHELIRIMPHAKNRAETYLDWLNKAMLEFDIDNPLREAAFLAQVAHESGELKYTEEIYGGEKYDVGRLAIKLGNTPEDDGDGEATKGAGLIQLTGTANHRACADYFGIPYDKIADWLKQPEGACRSAGWFWKTRGLSELADNQNYLLITKRINGGTNGYAERCKYYERALDVLGVNLGAGC